MKRIFRPAALLLVTAGLVVGGASAVNAAPAAQHSAVSMAKLTIKVTDTGTVWGTVKVKYTVAGKSTTKSCNAASCKYNVPKGAKLHLSQTPTNTSTWPFKRWTIKAGSTTKTSVKNSITVTFSKPTVITAVYVVA